MIISPRILHKTGNISDKRRANQNVFYVQHIFLKFRNAYEIKSKNFVDPARPEALCVLDNYGHKITFFFFNRHCNPCGFWPAQLSLNILSRKDFTECRCQRQVKPPNLEDQWLEHSNPGVPHVWKEASELQQQKKELWARNCREF